MCLFFQVLASGSKGNAILIGSDSTRIMLDAGLSARELSKRLEGAGFAAEQLDALIISHEHQDHVLGAGPLSRRYDLPVYLTQGTLEHLPPKVGQLASTQVFRSGVSFRIGDLLIHPFAICHDAREPVGFVFEHNGSRMGVCTDLGVVTQLVRSRLQGCHGLIIESNYDPERLKNGPYTWSLKQRIAGSHGHLSNSDTIGLLRDIHHPGLRAVLMAHLSETNNDPALVRQGIEELRNEPEWEGVSFKIGKQHEAGESVELP